MTTINLNVCLTYCQHFTRPVTWKYFLWNSNNVKTIYLCITSWSCALHDNKGFIYSDLAPSCIPFQAYLLLLLKIFSFILLPLFSIWNASAAPHLLHNFLFHIFVIFLHLLVSLINYPSRFNCLPSSPLFELFHCSALLFEISVNLKYILIYNTASFIFELYYSFMSQDSLRPLYSQYRQTHFHV